METSGTPPVRAAMVQNADGTWSPMTTTAKSVGTTTYGTPQMIGIMAQNPDGTWSGWDGSSGTTTPPEQVYPPAGIAVSTGTAWGTPIDATNPVFAGTVAAGGGDLRMGDRSGGIQAGPANINADTSNIFVNAAAGAGRVYFNWDQGTSGVIFGNGASVSIGSIDGSGNAHFNGAVTSGAVNLTETIESLQTRIAALEAKVG